MTIRNCYLTKNSAPRLALALRVENNDNDGRAGDPICVDNVWPGQSDDRKPPNRVDGMRRRQRSAVVVTYVAAEGSVRGKNPQRRKKKEVLGDVDV